MFKKRFTVKKGIVTDSENKLMWTKNANLADEKLMW